ncbi:hypothetical protein BKA70DRAFT_1242077 [Coprinopsis sp. MPI-PUGE-AT-0042]|nr:hypothetical protein BKA70DRAFT_1242077 [Coprinopsis sp. MPI-PUGE-AT-0042]
MPSEVSAPANGQWPNSSDDSNGRPRFSSESDDVTLLDHGQDTHWNDKLHGLVHDHFSGLKTPAGSKGKGHEQYQVGPKPELKAQQTFKSPLDVVSGDRDVDFIASAMATSSQEDMLSMGPSDVGHLLEVHRISLMLYYLLREMNQKSSDILAFLHSERNGIFGDGTWFLNHLDDLDEAQREAAKKAINNWGAGYKHWRPTIDALLSLPSVLSSSRDLHT